MAESRLYVGKDKDGKTVVGAYNDFAIANREELVSKYRDAAKNGYEGHVNAHIEAQLDEALSVATAEDMEKFPRLPEANITITYLDERNQGALCHKYPSQSEPQPCHIELDTRDGEVCASFSGDIGGAIPMPVYNGAVRWYGINMLSAESANDLMIDIAPLADQVVANFEKDMRNVEEVEYKIERICMDRESDIEIVDLDVYFMEGHPDKLNALTSDEQLREIADESESDLGWNYKNNGIHYVLEDDMYDYLEVMRDKMVKEIVTDPESAGFDVERIELLDDSEAVIHLTHNGTHYAAIRGTDGEFDICGKSSVQTDGDDRHDVFASAFGPHLNEFLENLDVPTSKDEYLDLVAHEKTSNPQAANIDEIISNLSLESIDLNDAPGGYVANYTLKDPAGDTCATIELRRRELLGGDVGGWEFVWSNDFEEELVGEDIAAVLGEHFDATKIAKGLNLPETYLDIKAAFGVAYINDYMTEPLPLVEQLRDGYAVDGNLAPGYYLDGDEAGAFYEENLKEERYIEAKDDNEAIELFAKKDRGAIAAHWAKGDDGRMHIQAVIAIPEEEALKLQEPEEGKIPEAWREAGTLEPEKESEVER
jgi:hypothetical protein